MRIYDVPEFRYACWGILSTSTLERCLLTSHLQAVPPSPPHPTYTSPHEIMLTSAFNLPPNQPALQSPLGPHFQNTERTPPHPPHPPTPLHPHPPQPGPVHQGDPQQADRPGGGVRIHRVLIPCRGGTVLDSLRGTSHAAGRASGVSSQLGVVWN